MKSIIAIAMLLGANAVNLRTNYSIDWYDRQGYDDQKVETLATCNPCPCSSAAPNSNGTQAAGGGCPSAAIPTLAQCNPCPSSSAAPNNNW